MYVSEEAKNFWLSSLFTERRAPRHQIQQWQNRMNLIRFVEGERIWRRSVPLKCENLTHYKARSGFTNFMRSKQTLLD